MSCEICTEIFNKSTNSVVTCCHCSKTACKNCVRTYLLSIDDEAQCMFCNNPQDLVFLASNINKTWVHSTYKKHREKILLDKQVAQLPDTQDKAKRTRLSRQHTAEIEALNKQKKELVDNLKKINNEVQQHRISIHTLLNPTPGTSSSFTFKCPSPECVGFLDSSWVCGTCEKKTCKECLEVMDEHHECNPEKIETVKMIKKDTKPCPGCGEFIHKIHGCDQMWCPTCKVAFSWRTGQIEKGAIHNPEYYRWMRENNEEIIQPRNNECGQIPCGAFLLRSIRKIWIPTGSIGRLVDDIAVHMLYNCHRLINHINHIDQAYRQEIAIQDTKLENLRVKYLMNEITKDAWMVKIQIQDKAFKKSTDIINIWRLVRDATLPLLWNTVEQFHKTENLGMIKEFIMNNIFPAMEKIRLFCNESFIRVGKLYCNNTDIITPVWSNMSYDLYKRTSTTQAIADQEAWALNNGFRRR